MLLIVLSLLLIIVSLAGMLTSAFLKLMVLTERIEMLEANAKITDAFVTVTGRSLKAINNAIDRLEEKTLPRS